MNNIGSLKIPYESNNKLNEIFYYYNYIIKKAMFDVYASTHEEVRNVKPIQTTFRNNSNRFYWNSKDNDPNITFYFQEPIHLTDYVIKNAAEHTYPTEFKVYGSNDNESWTEIDHQNNVRFCSSTICGSSTEKNFTLNDNSKYFHYIRLMNIRNSHYKNNKYILFSAIEFFGEIGMRTLCTNHNQYFTNIRLFYSFISIQIMYIYK